jgi:hypothetical protein
MKRPRVTVRRMMILVAIVALVIGGEKMRRRWLGLREMAAEHKFRAEACETVASEQGPRWRRYAHYRTVAAYSRRMQIKYEHAMRRPWLSVEPDPPKPKDNGP